MSVVLCCEQGAIQIWHTGTAASDGVVPTTRIPAFVSESGVGRTDTGTDTGKKIVEIVFAAV